MHSFFEKTKEKLSKPIVSYPLGVTLGVSATILRLRSKSFVMTMTLDEARKLVDNPAGMVIFKHRFLGYALLRVMPKP